MCISDIHNIFILLLDFIAAISDFFSFNMIKKKKNHVTDLQLIVHKLCAQCTEGSTWVRAPRNPGENVEMCCCHNSDALICFHLLLCHLG